MLSFFSNYSPLPSPPSAPSINLHFTDEYLSVCHPFLPINLCIYLKDWGEKSGKRNKIRINVYNQTEELGTWTMTYPQFSNFLKNSKYLNLEEDNSIEWNIQFRNLQNFLFDKTKSFVF